MSRLFFRKHDVRSGEVNGAVRVESDPVERLNGADGIRALACLMVIILHIVMNLETFYKPEWVREVQRFLMMGNNGVSFFFVLSGYLLSYPFWKAYLRGDGFPGIREYVIRRAARIMPGYYVAFAVAIAFALVLYPSLEHFWRRLAAGLTFLTGFHYSTFVSADFDPPLWSIGVEVFFYLMLPVFMAGLFFLVRGGRSFRKALIYWVCALGVVLAGNGLIHHFLTPDSIDRGFEFGNIGGMKSWMPNYNPVGLFGQFMFGILASGINIRIGKMPERDLKIRNRGIYDFAAVVIMLSMVIFFWFMRRADQFSFSFQRQPYFFPFLAIMIAALLVALSRSERVGRMLDNRFFRYTAKISFGLYIWHYIIINIISNFWLRDYFPISAQGWGTWCKGSVVVVVASYIVATLSYYVIEKPVIDRVHGVFAKKGNPVIRYRRKLRPGTVISIVLICALALVFIYPLVWLFDASLRPLNELGLNPPVLFQKPIWEAVQTYTRAGYLASFLRWEVGPVLLNSVVVSSVAIVLSVLVCSLCAYSLVFIRYTGRKVVMLLVIGSIILPTNAFIISLYNVINKVHLANNWMGFILPACASGFGVFLLRQYFLKIPMAVVESARMDGARHLQIWWHIILPLSRPALAAMVIIQFRFIWNDFLLPLIIMRDETLYTFPIKLNSLVITGDFGSILATSFITVIIPIALFIRFHKQFMESLAGGGQQ